MSDLRAKLCWHSRYTSFRKPVKTHVFYSLIIISQFHQINANYLFSLQVKLNFWKATKDFVGYKF